MDDDVKPSNSHIALNVIEDDEGNGAYHYVGGTPPAGLVGAPATIIPGTCLAADGTAAT